jgi:hypothetical protein
VAPAAVNLTGFGRVFRVMVEAESAANDVPDPALFSDPYSRWCYDRGARRTAVEYIRATEEMFRRSREIIQASIRWDCLLTPTVALPPQPLDAFLADAERVAEDDLAYIPFTYPFNILGQPAISLPLGWTDDGLPIGVQLVGQPYGEASIIALAAQVERAAPWGACIPPRCATPPDPLTQLWGRADEPKAMALLSNSAWSPFPSGRASSSRLQAGFVLTGKPRGHRQARPDPANRRRKTLSRTSVPPEALSKRSHRKHQIRIAAMRDKRVLVVRSVIRVTAGGWFVDYTTGNRPSRAVE